MHHICAPWENLCTQNESKYSETNVLPAYGNITELIEDYYLSAYLTKSNMHSWAIANETNTLSTRTPDLLYSIPELVSCTLLQEKSGDSVIA